MAKLIVRHHKLHQKVESRPDSEPKTIENQNSNQKKKKKSTKIFDRRVIQTLGKFLRSLILARHKTIPIYSIIM